MHALVLHADERMVRGGDGVFEDVDLFVDLHHQFV